MKLILLALAAPLVAQITLPPTTVPPSLLRESTLDGALATPPSMIRLFAVASNGNLLRVRPGAGLTLRSTPGGL